MSFKTEPSHAHETNTAAPHPTEVPEHNAPEPSTRHERRILELLHETYGDAFQCYLTHVWEGCPIIELEETFQNLYWGTFPDRKTFIDSFLEAMEWREGIDEARSRLAIPEGVLYWNYPALLQEVQVAYEFLDSGGETHAFLK